SGQNQQTARALRPESSHQENERVIVGTVALRRGDRAGAHLDKILRQGEPRWPARETRSDGQCTAVRGAKPKNQFPVSAGSHGSTADRERGGGGGAKNRARPVQRRSRHHAAVLIGGDLVVAVARAVVLPNLRQRDGVRTSLNIRRIKELG